jgi:hypothetical protein
VSGRTSWYPTDAAEADRELNVELGDEFGPAGPLVMRLMKDFAGQQDLRGEGQVRTGFRVLAKKCHIERDESQKIIERAAEIGALDDLRVDEDGRRFTCRVSGWKADFNRGKSTLKKGDQRANQGDEPPPEGDVSPRGGDVSQDDVGGGARPGPSDIAEPGARADDRSAGAFCPPSEETEGAAVPPAQGHEPALSPLAGDMSPESSSTGQDTTSNDDEREGAHEPALGPVVVHPQLGEVLQRLSTVDGLAVDEMAVLSALRRAERAGADALDVTDATVSLALEYAAKGCLRANGASVLMHRVMDRRDSGTAEQLAQASAAARSAAAGGRAARPARDPSFDHIGRTSA